MFGFRVSALQANRRGDNWRDAINTRATAGSAVAAVFWVTFVPYTEAANQHGHTGASAPVAVQTKLVVGFPVKSEPTIHTSFAMHVTV